MKTGRGRKRGTQSRAVVRTIRFTEENWKWVQQRAERESRTAVQQVDYYVKLARERGE